MAEGLWEVAEEVTVPKVDLFGQQAQVTRVTYDAVEQRLGAFVLAGERKRAYEPKEQITNVPSSP